MRELPLALTRAPAAREIEWRIGYARIAGRTRILIGQI